MIEDDFPPPYMRAWAEQFGALLRDKVRQMQEAVAVTGWRTLAHVFNDPYEHDVEYRLVYDHGEYSLVRADDPDAVIVIIAGAGFEPAT
jgi:hypothetical protein